MIEVWIRDKRGRVRMWSRHRNASRARAASFAALRAGADRVVRADLRETTREKVHEALAAPLIKLWYELVGS